MTRHCLRRTSVKTSKLKGELGSTIEYEGFDECLGGVNLDTGMKPLQYDNPEAIGEIYFGSTDLDSDRRTLRPSSVNSPRMRTVAMASKVTGTHMPPSSPYCRVI